MIELISQAIIDEVNAYKAADTTGMYLGATVMIDTDFNIHNVPSYTLPLIILEIDDAPNSVQLVGGATQMEWNSVYPKRHFQEHNSIRWWVYHS